MSLSATSHSRTLLVLRVLFVGQRSFQAQCDNTLEFPPLVRCDWSKLLRDCFVTFSNLMNITNTFLLRSQEISFVHITIPQTPFVKVGLWYPHTSQCNIRVCFLCDKVEYFHLISFNNFS